MVIKRKYKVTNVYEESVSLYTIRNNMKADDDFHHNEYEGTTPEVMNGVKITIYNHHITFSKGSIHITLDKNTTDEEILSIEKLFEEDVKEENND